MSIAGIWTRARPWLAGALLVWGGWGVWGTFLAQRPLVSWYAPRLAVVWALTALFAVSCLAVGARVVRSLSGPVRRDGFFALAFAAGVLVFGVSLASRGMYGGITWIATWENYQRVFDPLGNIKYTD